MTKQIVFDMDGTLFDFYGAPDWLPKLHAEDVSPYLDAKPMWDMWELTLVLLALKARGWRIVVNSWLAMNSSEEYKRQVRMAKRIVLTENFLAPSLFDEIHLVAYGTPKTKPMRNKGGMLIDDNAEVRGQWERNGGKTIDPTTTDIIKVLKKLLEDN